MYHPYRIPINNVDTTKQLTVRLEDIPSGNDFDIRVRSQYHPSPSLYDGGSINGGNTPETVTIFPKNKYVHVMVYLYSGGGGTYTLCSAQNPATVNVVVQQGRVTVKVWRNGSFVGQTSSSQVFYFRMNDNLQFQVIPATGCTFNKSCVDSASSTSTASNPFSATIKQSSG